MVLVSYVINIPKLQQMEKDVQLKHAMKDKRLCLMDLVKSVQIMKELKAMERIVVQTFVNHNKN